MKFDTREAYLTEAADLILDDILMPIVEASDWDYERPKYRISVGFPKHSRSGKAVAVCFPRASSSDDLNEIFVTPERDDPMQVLADLLHELIHSIDDLESGHRNFFAHVARKAGLEGKLTSTYAGEGLLKTLSEYALLLGDYPHHKMTITHKKQTTRQLKLSCTECGFVMRTSQKWMDCIEPTVAACPVCHRHGKMVKQN